jgi:hypothetical protein
MSRSWFHEVRRVFAAAAEISFDVIWIWIVMSIVDLEFVRREYCYII